MGSQSILEGVGILEQAGEEIGLDVQAHTHAGWNVHFWFFFWHSQSPKEKQQNKSLLLRCGGGGVMSEYSLVGEERTRDIVNLDVSHCAIPLESLFGRRVGR